MNIAPPSVLFSSAPWLNKTEFKVNSDFVIVTFEPVRQTAPPLELEVFTLKPVLL